MHHCYISREHGLDFWCIRLLTPLGGSNLLTLKIEGRLWLLPQQLHLQRLRVWMLIHLPNEEVKPGNLKPSYILASRVAGLKDCAPSPGLLILHFFHAFSWGLFNLLILNAGLPYCMYVLSVQFFFNCYFFLVFLLKFPPYMFYFILFLKIVIPK